MSAYFKAVFSHTRTATVDVLFVAGVSLTPLFLGRLPDLVNQKTDLTDYLGFLTNGQLAFFSMGSLATLLLFCFRKRLPDGWTLTIGSVSLILTLFLSALVVIDPTLQKGQSFVGKASLFLFLGILALRILADAMKAVNAGDALQAGSTASDRVKQGLSERKGSGAK